MGNLYRTKDQTDRIYQKGGKLLKDEKYHYLYDRNGNLKLKTQRKVGQHQLKIREEEVSKKPKKFSFFVEEIKEDIGRKDLEYYLRNDRKYTQAEKEEYKRLKAERERQTAQNEEWQRGDWEYSWNADGSLRSVKLPNGDLVQYEYDALGRRTKKIVNNKIIRYLWDGNVLLHEWEYDIENEPKKVINELGEIGYDKKEPVNNLITWVYENNSFVPCAKLTENGCFSIISDYIGRPILAFDSKGEKIWSAEYDIYGNLRNLKGDRNFVPFRQLGQYEDVETGLYYNRFRYYDPASGLYISKDPISILGGLNVYAYVFDSNIQVDVWGLMPLKGGLTKKGLKRLSKEWLSKYGPSSLRKHHLIPQEMMKDEDFIKHLNKLTKNDAETYIHKQIAIIENELHQKIHSKGWNFDFQSWADSNKYKFSLEDIQSQINKMMKDYNVPFSSRNFSKKYCT